MYSKINFREAVASFDARSLSAESGLTPQDAAIINEHFSLQSICRQDIENLRDYITLYVMIMVKGLPDGMIDEKFRTLSKITAVMDLHLGKAAQTPPEDEEI